MADIFTWPMDASFHRIAVNVLREEILHAVNTNGSLPIAHIFLTLPVITSQIQDAVQRGAIQCSQGRFENLASDELWMQFDDPAMGTFYATVPATLSGGVTSPAGNDLLVIFDNPIQLEIADLENLGVARSRFQNTISIHLRPNSSLTVLTDDADANKETHIDVSLGSGPIVPLEKLTATRVSSLVRFGNGASFECGSGGGGNTGGSDWHVLKRRNDGICFVHEGDIVMGGSQAYDVLLTGTYDQCNSYVNTHCPDGFC